MRSPFKRWSASCALLGLLLLGLGELGGGLAALAGVEPAAAVAIPEPVFQGDDIELIGATITPNAAHVIVAVRWKKATGNLLGVRQDPDLGDRSFIKLDKVDPESFGIGVPEEELPPIDVNNGALLPAPSQEAQKVVYLDGGKIGLFYYGVPSIPLLKERLVRAQTLGQADFLNIRLVTTTGAPLTPVTATLPARKTAEMDPCPPEVQPNTPGGGGGPGPGTPTER